MRHGRYYYMFSAEGGTSGPPTSHMSIVARARHLAGPWTNSPYNPLVHTYSRHQTWWSTGHGMPVKAPDGDWYLIFHGYRKNYLTLGRPVLMEPIRWTQDGWVKLLRGSRPSAPLPAPGDAERGDRKKPAGKSPRNYRRHGLRRIKAAYCVFNLPHDAVCP